MGTIALMVRTIMSNMVTDVAASAVCSETVDDRRLSAGRKRSSMRHGIQGTCIVSNMLFQYVRYECLGIGDEISYSQPFFRE